jgi:hypothetical protein
MVKLVEKMDVKHYLKLVSKAFGSLSTEDIDAVIAYELEYPDIADITYKDGGEYVYDILTGTLTKKNGGV